MHLKEKMPTFTISYALLMLYIQLHFAHSGFLAGSIDWETISKDEKLRDTEKGKAYRKNYLRRERRLDVNKFKSLKICPSAPSSKIPTLYYSEVQEN